MPRILFGPLLLAKLAHVGDDLLQAGHPVLGVLLRVGNQVKVFLVALEQNGECPRFHRLLCVLPETLRVSAGTHTLYILNGNCGKKQKGPVRANAKQ